MRSVRATVPLPTGVACRVTVSASFPARHGTQAGAKAREPVSGLARPAKPAENSLNLVPAADPLLRDPPPAKTLAVPGAGRLQDAGQPALRGGIGA